MSIASLFIAAIIGIGLALIVLIGIVIHVQAKRYDRQEAADRALMECERVR